MSSSYLLDTSGGWGTRNKISENGREDKKSAPSRRTSNNKILLNMQMLKHIVELNALEGHVLDLWISLNQHAKFIA
jgi:hypothetical protein